MLYTQGLSQAQTQKTARTPTTQTTQKRLPTQHIQDIKAQNPQMLTSMSLTLSAPRWCSLCIIDNRAFKIHKLPSTLNLPRGILYWVYHQLRRRIKTRRPLLKFNNDFLKWISWRFSVTSKLEVSLRGASMLRLLLSFRRFQRLSISRTSSD
jgi:hypothetical protein